MNKSLTTSRHVLKKHVIDHYKVPFAHLILCAILHIVTLFNPLTPGTFCKKCVFLGISVIFRLDLGQITFDLVENAFATQ